eukprot:5029892-Prymnesium_polylepis.1
MMTCFELGCLSRHSQYTAAGHSITRRARRCTRCMAYHSLPGISAMNQLFSSSAQRVPGAQHGAGSSSSSRASVCVRVVARTL